MSTAVNLEDRQSDQIEWKQLWSLASLYASIIIGWIAYHNYQPKLLTTYHFEIFTLPLAMVQGIILTITPIYAGRIGDRYRLKSGHRLPIISNGISFASMVFMAVAFTLIGNPGEVFKWVLPILIILWLVAMSIFTSPALSTLELFTPVDKLPRAMAVLTIVSNLVYALEPAIVDIIDFFGAPVTFIAGGLAVFLSGWALRKNSLGLFKSNEKGSLAQFTFDTQRSQYARIFFIGIILGLSSTILFNIFPASIEAKLASVFTLEGQWWVVGILVFSALISVPVSNQLTRYGIDNMYRVGMSLVLIGGVSILLVSSAWITSMAILVFAFGFTILSVSSLPLVIRNANYYEKVFCVGIFFSGVALPEGIIESYLKF